MKRELAPYPVPESLHGTQACAGADTDIFFIPETPRGARRKADIERARRQEAQAKALCVRCPFVVACLKYALDRPSELGIWGGLNEEERNDIRQGRRSA